MKIIRGNATLGVLDASIDSPAVLVTVEKHPLAAKAKDIGSAGVVTCIILCALVWAGVIWSAKI